MELKSGAGSFLDLANRVRQGDRSAEETVAAFFLPRIQAFARARTMEREVAGELAQDVMLAVICSLREGRVEQPENLPAYVYGIARNLVNDSFRTQARRPVEALPDRFDPPASFDSGEVVRRLTARQVIAELDRTDQRILLMILVEGRTPSEVAPLVGLSPEAVRQRKSRALRRVVERVNEAPVSQKPSPNLPPDSAGARREGST